MPPKPDRMVCQGFADKGVRRAEAIRFCHDPVKAPCVATLKPVRPQHPFFIYISKRFLELKKTEALWAELKSRAVSMTATTNQTDHPQALAQSQAHCGKR
jgi:hypothetical protein